MTGDKWKGSPYIVASLALLIATPLFGEFSGGGPVGPKVLAGLILVALAIGAFALTRFFVRNWDDIGEARFDTTDESDRQ